MKFKLKKTIIKNWNWIGLAIALLIATYLCFGFYYGLSWSNGADNYIYSSDAYMWLHLGQWDNGSFSTRVLTILGIAFFYKLLGPSQFSVVLFDVFCLLGTMVIVYFIGSELYDKRAGVLSALVYGLMPIAVEQASMTSDDISMAFMASLAVLFLLLAVKYKKGKRMFYTLSGLFGILTFWTTPEGPIIFVFLIPVLLARIIKNFNRKEILRAAFFFLGIVIGLGMMGGLDYVISGVPLHFYTVNAQSYTNDYCNNAACKTLFNTDSLNYYLSNMFTYNLIASFSNAVNAGSISAVYNSTVSFLNPAANSNGNSYDFEHAFYIGTFLFLLLCALRDRKVLFPSAWVILVFLYLAFGTMSLSRYIKLVPQYSRYELLFLPGLALLIGFGLARLMEPIKKKRINAFKKYLPFTLALLIMFLLFFDAVYSVQMVNYSWYNRMYQFVQAGKFIAASNQSINIVRDVGSSIDEYTDYRSNYITSYGLTLNSSNCDKVPQNSYVVMFANQTLQNVCDLSVALPPQESPEWLQKYNHYLQMYQDFATLTVYYKG